MGKINPFYVLGIDETSTLKEAKRAYREKVKENHPDRYAHHPLMMKSAEEKMKEINIAYKSVVAILTERQRDEYQKENSLKTKTPSSKRKAESANYQNKNAGKARTGASTTDSKKNTKNTNFRIIGFILDELQKINFKRLRIKTTRRSKPPPTKPKLKEQRNFNEIFNEILMGKMPPSERGANTYNNKKRRGTPYTRYSNKYQKASKRNSGPIEGIKPVSKIKGIYNRDN